MGRLSPSRSIESSAVTLGVAALVVWGPGCQASPASPEGRSDPITISRDGGGEVPCAWFGDERDGALWFGVSGFWSAQRRSGGDPAADLEQASGRWIGRHVLGSGRTTFAGQPGGPFPSGVWDVLAHPNGRLYFTTFFDRAGILEAGGWQALGAGTIGLNELALGPSGRILASRYGSGGDGSGAEPGAVVVLGEDGRIQAELPLDATGYPSGYRVAAKSLAWDPLRGEIWVNTDLLPPDETRPIRHDTRILSAGGSELLRWETPEVQFMVFGPDGSGYFAEVDGERLRLRIRPPGAAKSALGTGRWVALDDGFPVGLDFVQEVRVADDGRAVVTRWSGRVHVVSRDGAVRDVELPRIEGDLFYTGVLHGDRVCATVCRTRPESSPEWVICADLPD